MTAGVEAAFAEARLVLFRSVDAPKSVASAADNDSAAVEHAHLHACNFRRLVYYDLRGFLLFRRCACNPPGKTKATTGRRRLAEYISSGCLFGPSLRLFDYLVSDCGQSRAVSSLVHVRLQSRNEFGAACLEHLDHRLQLR